MIRPIDVQNACAFLNLCRQLDQETHYMMFEPGERTTTVEEQTQRMMNSIWQRSYDNMEKLESNRM